MTQSHQQSVRDFFVAIAKGTVPDELVTDDMTFWSINSGAADKARFTGAMKILSSIFSGTLIYDIEALTAEADRVVAEIKSRGTLTTGEAFNNIHVFIFRFRDGRIASVAEFMNQFIVREKIVPLMQAAMQSMQK
jgi:ketosteroid isomerase-like protein